MVDEIIVGILTTVAGVWLGSLEWRLKSMDVRLRDAPSRKEVIETIDIKQEAGKAIQKEIQEDIRDIRRKLDQLIDLQIKKG